MVVVALFVTKKTQKTNPDPVRRPVRRRPSLNARAGRARGGQLLQRQALELAGRLLGGPDGHAAARHGAGHGAGAREGAGPEAALRGLRGGLRGAQRCGGERGAPRLRERDRRPRAARRHRGPAQVQVAGLEALAGEGAERGDERDRRPKLGLAAGLQGRRPLVRRQARRGHGAGGMPGGVRRAQLVGAAPPLAGRRGRSWLHGLLPREVAQLRPLRRLAASEGGRLGGGAAGPLRRRLGRRGSAEVAVARRPARVRRMGGVQRGCAAAVAALVREGRGGRRAAARVRRVSHVLGGALDGPLARLFPGPLARRRLAADGGPVDHLARPPERSLTPLSTAHCPPLQPAASGPGLGREVQTSCSTSRDT